MIKHTLTHTLSTALLMLAVSAPLAALAATVDEAAIRATEQAGGEWLSHGRTYAEQRFSPLKQIDAGNVGKLGLAWHLDLENNRGLEATPLVSDGVLYASLSWSRAIAVDVYDVAKVNDILVGHMGLNQAATASVVSPFWHQRRSMPTVRPSDRASRWATRSWRSC